MIAALSNERSARHVRTLVVDANNKPFAVVSVQDVITDLSLQEMGDDRYPLEVVLSDNRNIWRSKHIELPTPLIVRTSNYNNETEDTNFMKYPRRRVLFYRDNFTCQYCGERAGGPGRSAWTFLTVDHVIPACLFESRKAATTWENITTACRPCNQRKGHKLPEEFGKLPAAKPAVPHISQILFAGKLNAPQKEFVRNHYKLEAKAVAL